jgi:hypothetical protein
MFFKNGSSKVYSSNAALLVISSKSGCDTFDNEISYKEDPTLVQQSGKVLTRGMVRFLTAANDSGGIWLVRLPYPKIASRPSADVPSWWLLVGLQFGLGWTGKRINFQRAK